MRKKIVLSYFVLGLIMFVSFASISGISIRKTLENQITQSFLDEINLIELNASIWDFNDASAQEFAEYLNLDATQRITIVNESGIVVADNFEDPKKMDNHLMRPEIKSANSQEQYGVSIRYSSTIRQEAIYVARSFEVGERVYYLRLSKPFLVIKEFNQFITRYTIIAFSLVALSVFVMAYFFTKKLTDPIIRLKEDVNQIAEGAYEKTVYTAQTDEIGQLGDAFNKMRQSLVLAMSNLESRNAELKAILNSMASGVIAVDCKHQIMMINQKSREILNLPESLIGIQDSMYRIIRDDEIIEMVNDSIKNGREQTRELQHVHLDKSLRVSIHPILTAEAEILGSMIVIEDITQMKKLENMRSDFVSNVSHELKTPLTSILGFVDTLKNGAITDVQKAMRFLGIIEDESERLNRLITDILLLSDIENPKKDLESSLVQVDTIIKEVVDMLQQRVEGKPVQLILECQERINMFVNRDRIKQMAINLIDNALKYTEEGYVKISLNADQTDMILIIEDTGIGIPEQHQSRLFERFYRVDKARSRKVGGTGLGLSIVKHIVHQYKGEIHVESAIGKGSTFTVKLPIKQS